tara:strand:+ start:1606 stop:1827 length:222 start_codon:yes stop_codon:yes gene_type:complete
MKTVKDKNKYLNFISSLESKVFNKVDLTGFLSVNTLNEREQYIAEELYKKDILQKITQGEQVGYKIYPQKTKL